MCADVTLIMQIYQSKQKSVRTDGRVSRDGDDVSWLRSRACGRGLRGSRQMSSAIDADDFDNFRIQPQVAPPSTVTSATEAEVGHRSCLHGRDM